MTYFRWEFVYLQNDYNMLVHLSPHGVLCFLGKNIQSIAHQKEKEYGNVKSHNGSGLMTHVHIILTQAFTAVYMTWLFYNGLGLYPSY